MCNDSLTSPPYSLDSPKKRITVEMLSLGIYVKKTLTNYEGDTIIQATTRSYFPFKANAIYSLVAVEIGACISSVTMSSKFMCKK